MAVKVADEFTGTNGDLLTARTPDTGTGYTKEEDSVGTIDPAIQANMAQPDGGSHANSRVLMTAQPNPTNNEYDITYVFDLVPGGGQPYMFALARWTDNDNYYTCGTYRAGNNPDKRLAKRVATTPTTLATANNGSTPDQTHKFEVRDSAKKMFEAGSEILSDADDALTSNGRWGFGWGNAIISTDDVNSGMRLDSLSIDEVAAGGADVRRHVISAYMRGLMVLMFVGALFQLMRTKP